MNVSNNGVCCGPNWHSCALPRTHKRASFGISHKRITRPSIGVRFMVCLFGFQLGSYQEKMLSWGRALSGQLGLGGIEEEFVSAPMRSKHLGSHRVLQVATGLQHTLILLDNGCVLSCGKNESGQLGQDKSCLRPGVCVYVCLCVCQHLSCHVCSSLGMPVFEIVM